VRKFKPPS